MKHWDFCVMLPGIPVWPLEMWYYPKLQFQWEEWWSSLIIHWLEGTLFWNKPISHIQPIPKKQRMYGWCGDADQTEITQHLPCHVQVLTGHGGFCHPNTGSSHGHQLGRISKQDPCSPFMVKEPHFLWGWIRWCLDPQDPNSCEPPDRSKHSKHSKHPKPGHPTFQSRCDPMDPRPLPSCWRWDLKGMWSDYEYDYTPTRPRLRLILWTIIIHNKKNH
jgi:hypothetical protein